MSVETRPNWCYFLTVKRLSGFQITRSPRSSGTMLPTFLHRLACLAVFADIKWDNSAIDIPRSRQLVHSKGNPTRKFKFEKYSVFWTIEWYRYLGNGIAVVQWRGAYYFYPKAMGIVPKAVGIVLNLPKAVENLYISSWLIGFPAGFVIV